MGGGTSHGDPSRYFSEVVLLYEGTECLIWPFARNKGYGVMYVRDGNVEVHRFLCEIANGPPPFEGCDARHSCGRGHEGCVTRHHLIWGTRRENAADTVAHGRSTRGAKNAQAKLSETQVRKIRSLKGKKSEAEIGEMFSISPAQAGNILRRKAWGWLPD